MSSAIIFGCSGQDGYYLSHILAEKGFTVTGVSRSSPESGDVSDKEFVTGLIQKIKPDRVFHLAANSTTRHDALVENHSTISTGSLNILEAVYKFCPDCRVFITGSGVQFENTGLPISENDPFVASSSYAAERIYSVYLARYFRSLGVKAFVGYLFHHESPLRKATHISQKIVQTVKRIVSGSQEQLQLGDISVQKEWAFAGDIARGMLALTDQEKVFEAVIGTGRAYSIEDWLNVCFGRFNLDWKQYVQLIPGFVPEYRILVSSPSTINALGWTPEVGFSELAKMMLDAEREKGLGL